jgi:DNA polymerase
VFSSGRANARLVLVGEQPGDQEDKQREPFVGPAGRLLDRGLDDAGIDREDVYVTNAVKHFRFTQTAPGKRRIHEKPAAAHIGACRPWLQAELDVVAPDIVVALGATAARALFGPSFRLTKERGWLIDGTDRVGSEHRMLATLHPSAILRTRGSDREAAYEGFVADLRVAAEGLAHTGR